MVPFIVELLKSVGRKGGYSDFQIASGALLSQILAEDVWALLR